ncbi:unnamed protein product [Cochlearia groenlandica]
MHSLKTTFPGQVFALAKPHDSVGKRTRNRIPKEERKTLVESFIKKHQKLNNGSFPSLSLTHKEVGGSFYTIREIVREIIQENRVLGAGDWILEGKGSDHLRDQNLSSSVLVDDPVPPLSLSPNGFHSATDQNSNFCSEAGKDKSHGTEENVDDSQVRLEERGSDILNFEEMKATKLLKEDIEMLANQSMDTTDVSKTQFEASCCGENDTNHYIGLHDREETVCDNFATQPQDNEVDVDNKDTGFEEIPIIESEGTKPVNNERMNGVGTVMTGMVNMTENALCTADLQAEVVVETFPVRSVTSALESSVLLPSELDKVCESGKGTEANVETDSSEITYVDPGEVSSSTSAIPEEQETEANGSQIPNHISVPIEKNVEEKIVNPASIDVECADTKEKVLVDAVIDNIRETKEFSNGSLTSGSEIGSCKNDIAKVDTMCNHVRNEVAIVENADMETEKLDAVDSSSSQKGNIATLNRIKPKSWKEESNKAGHETNPLVAALKSFLTAFVKFWSE